MRAVVEQRIAPEDLARVSDLSLLAQVLVAGQQIGLHRSPHNGSSVAFSQYRAYVQGDDPRAVDWKRYGRTDRLHVKEFHHESNMGCTLVLDCSASMGYGSTALSKFRYGQILCASLSCLLAQQHDEVSLVAYHDEICCHIPPQRRAQQLRRLIAALEGLKPAGNTATESALQWVGDMIAPRGMVVLVSDLLQPVPQVATQLRALRARRHDVLVFQLEDTAEVALPFAAGVTLVDPEGGGERTVDSARIRAAYQANRTAHFDEIRALCLAYEIDYMPLRTDQPLDDGLRHFLDRRTRTLRTSSRRGAAAGGRT